MRLSLKELAGTEKHLKYFTKEELLMFLNNNESTVPDVLACICSEILRRQLCCKSEDVITLWEPAE